MLQQLARFEMPFFVWETLGYVDVLKSYYL